MKIKYFAGIMLLSTGLAVTSCSDDDDYAISSSEIISTVDTGNAEVSAISATITGTVLDLTGQDPTAYSVGVCYSTSENAQAGKQVVGSIDENGTVTSVLTGLTEGVTYYYCSYVTLQKKVTLFGPVKSFVTTDAQIGTADAAAVTSVSAMVGATLNGVSDMIESGSSSLAYGVLLSTDQADDAVKNGLDIAASSTTNTFTVDLTGLVPNTTYYYMPYMTLEGGYIYGEKKTFTTTAPAIEFVDMGLSVEWATCNIGAAKPEDLGGLYGWGDVTGLNRSTQVSEYGMEGNISQTEYDICVKAGAGYLPTIEQVQELISKCTSEWTTVNGVAGYKFTASNGNSIFLPASGSRNGTTVSNEGVAGFYWTGSHESSAVDYANTLNFSQSGASTGVSTRYEGLAVRPVKKPDVITVPVDNSKIKFGALDNPANFRIEMYNEYGATKADPGIDISRLNFEKNCVIKFKISGIDGNLAEGAKGKYEAGMEYADASWDPSYWSSGRTKYDCEVSGDGEYTVWCEVASPSEGAMVFCVDVMGLMTDVVDASKVTAEILSVELDRKIDWVSEIPVDNSKILFNNKDGDGVNARIEIYNEYGDTKANPGVDISAINFAGRMSINFTITGIDGNLIPTATNAYNTEISYADASWDPSYWGGGSGANTISADGTYNVACQLNGTCEGAVVWAIEVYDLWKDLVDPSLVKVTINSITVEQAVE